MPKENKIFFLKKCKKKATSEKTNETGKITNHFA